MTVAFIIPAFNEEGNLPACIASIHANIGFGHSEIIVVDNCSTDNTRRVALECGATVVTARRKGIVFARQKGFEASDAQFLAFVDADNRLPPDWLCIALGSFDADTVAVSGPLHYFNSSLALRGASHIFYLVAWLAHQVYPMLQGGNFMVRRSALREVGGFDTSYLFYGEDCAHAIRLAKAGKLKFILGLWTYSSPRRLEAEGVILTTFRYVMSYLWVNLFGRPWTQNYNDIRQET